MQTRLKSLLFSYGDLFKQKKGEKNEKNKLEARKHEQTLTFFEDATVALQSMGKEDAAFYFQLVADHLAEGGTLNDKVERILLL